jgi:hypothetical protein
VFSNPKWQRIALSLNLLGTVLLFYSFQATSSDFKLVRSAPGSSSVLDQGPYAFHAMGVGSTTENYALCVSNYTLLASDAHSGVSFGHMGCPNWDKARPAAIVSIEHPFFEGLGFVCLLAGFLLQFLSVPQPRTIAEIRKELKLSRVKERAARKME